jgi:GTP-binding protein EngB required for normal cell division
MMTRIKHDLLMGHVRVKNLVELRENATDELITYFRDGRLVSFLEARDEPGLIEKIQSIKAKKNHEILESLLAILDIKQPVKITKNQKSTEKWVNTMRQKNDSKDENFLATYNVAVVGITGVGKSQFINYLCGSEIAKTGVGKPVTQNGFHAIQCTINKLPVTIFDSWGIEIETYAQWSKELEQELKNRGVEKFAGQWFHSIYYCINAGSSRIQDADISIIKRFIASKYNVTVILTKSDSLSDEAIAKFTACITEAVGEVAVMPVCSVTEVRRGYTITPFGKEEIYKKVYLDFWDAIVKRLPGRCEHVLRKEIKDWAASQRSYVKTHANTSILNLNTSEIEKKIQAELHDFKTKLGRLAIEEITATITMYDQMLSRLVINFDELKDIKYEEGVGSSELFDGNWIENIAIGLLFGIFAIPCFLYLLVAGYSDENEKLIKKIDDLERDFLKELPLLMRKVEAHLEEEKRVKTQQFRNLVPSYFNN